MNSSKTNLLNFDVKAMQDYFVGIGETRFRATQVIKWIHQQGETDFSKMTNLSMALREKLPEIAEITLPEVVFSKVASDGTIKWLLRLVDGNCIETVFIPDKGRGTLCVSSQVGCALNCSFCSTGAQGFNRDLTTAEIIGQVWIAAHNLEFVAQTEERKVTNVVMMGMGEPLLNFDCVLRAMNLMLEDNAYGLSKYRVTLSTSGLIPKMDELAQVSPVSLALSLHAPNNELRNQLVPLNKKYPIEELMKACKRFFKNEKKRKVTMEYVMLKGVNDQPEHARQLIKILKGVPAKMNLIPFNPFPMSKYERSSQATIDRFRMILIEGGVHTVTRKTRGENIDAACGQLAGDFKDRTKRRIRIVKAQEQLCESIS